jgi:hypothetical protein
MAANLGRWWKYAQAKLNSVVSDSNAELDDLEAEQAARADGKPWLSSDGAAPTLDEARARIEWESDEQRRRAEAEVAAAESPADGALARAESPTDPEVVKARLELDRQARESKDRLDAIRKELGVDPPT